MTILPLLLESALAHRDAMRAMAYASPRDARLAAAYRRAEAELSAIHAAVFAAVRAALASADLSTVKQ